MGKVRYKLREGVWIRLDNGEALIYDAQAKRILRSDKVNGAIMEAVRIASKSRDGIAEALGLGNHGSTNDQANAVRAALKARIEQLVKGQFLDAV